MGDRISIAFKNGNQTSVVLFNHWGGREFLQTVKQYYRELKQILSERKEGVSYPIDRLEPCTVMVDFIRWLTKDELVIEGNFYLGKDESDGDNSDNGHWVFDLQEGDFLHSE